MGAISLRDKIASLPREEQEAIAKRAAELKAEVRSLSELRKAKQITQEQLAKKLHVSQESVSRLEKRSDILLSTLGDVVRQLGGELLVLAQFPDAAPVRVRLGDEETSGKTFVRRRKVHKSKRGSADDAAQEKAVLSSKKPRRRAPTITSTGALMNDGETRSRKRA
jgi:transcriptional regulator with XRE-family HTH domain